MLFTCSFFYWGISKKAILFKHPYQIFQQENSSLFMNSILKNGKMRVENQTKTRDWEDSSLYPETSTKNAIKEFHLRSFLLFLILWWHRTPSSIVSQHILNGDSFPKPSYSCHWIFPELSRGFQAAFRKYEWFCTYGRINVQVPMK